jgi:hypothetical protein
MSLQGALAYAAGTDPARRQALRKRKAQIITYLGQVDSARKAGRAIGSETAVRYKKLRQELFVVDGQLRRLQGAPTVGPAGRPAPPNVGQQLVEDFQRSVQALQPRTRERSPSATSRPDSPRPRPGQVPFLPTGNPTLDQIHRQAVEDVAQKKRREERNRRLDTPGSLERSMAHLDAKLGDDPIYRRSRARIRQVLQIQIKAVAKQGGKPILRGEAEDIANVVLGREPVRLKAFLEQKSEPRLNPIQPEPDETIVDAWNRLYGPDGERGQVQISLRTPLGTAIRQLASTIRTPDYSEDMERFAESRWHGTGKIARGAGKVLHGAMDTFNPASSITGVYDTEDLIKTYLTSDEKLLDLLLGKNQQQRWDNGLEMLGGLLGSLLLGKGLKTAKQTWEAHGPEISRPPASHPEFSLGAPKEPNHPAPHHLPKSRETPHAEYGGGKSAAHGTGAAKTTQRKGARSHRKTAAPEELTEAELAEAIERQREIVALPERRMGKRVSENHTVLDHGEGHAQDVATLRRLEDEAERRRAAGLEEHASGDSRDASIRNKAETEASPHLVTAVRRALNALAKHVEGTGTIPDLVEVEGRLARPSEPGSVRTPPGTPDSPSTGAPNPADPAVAVGTKRSPTVTAGGGSASATEARPAPTTLPEPVHAEIVRAHDAYVAARPNASVPDRQTVLATAQWLASRWIPPSAVRRLPPRLRSVVTWLRKQGLTQGRTLVLRNGRRVRVFTTRGVMPTSGGTRRSLVGAVEPTRFSPRTRNSDVPDLGPSNSAQDTSGGGTGGMEAELPEGKWRSRGGVLRDPGGTNWNPTHGERYLPGFRGKTPQEVMHMIHGMDIEIVAVFDGDELLFDPKQGSRNRVDLTDEETEIARGMRILHNHPSDLPFSGEDVETMFHTQAQVDAATPSGVLYIMEPRNITLENVLELMREIDATADALVAENARRGSEGLKGLKGADAGKFVWELQKKIFGRYGIQVRRKSIWEE